MFVEPSTRSGLRFLSFEIRVVSLWIAQLAQMFASLTDFVRACAQFSELRIYCDSKIKLMKMSFKG